MQAELAPAADGACVRQLGGSVFLQVHQVVHVGGYHGDVLQFLVVRVVAHQHLGVLGDEERVVFAAHEVGHVHDALQIGQVGLQPRNLILVEHAAHTLDGILARGGPDDELADHGVVVDGDFVTLVDVAVDADADAVRLGQLLDDAGRGHEVVLRVLGTDAALDGVAALEELFLMQVQHFVVGDADLLFHQVHAHHFLRDGMLHL